MNRVTLGNSVTVAPGGDSGTTVLGRSAPGHRKPLRVRARKPTEQRIVSFGHPSTRKPFGRVTRSRWGRSVHLAELLDAPETAHFPRPDTNHVLRVLRDLRVTNAAGANTQPGAP